MNTMTVASQPSTRLRQATSTNARTVPLQKIETGEAIRSGHPGLDMFSPVTERGHFECDKVLKCGEVLRRTRKTKTWKPIYLVLRPNLLSVYKDKDESKLRDQIMLSELTAVARQKDPKRRAQHVFGLFSSSRNIHLSAVSEQDAQEWVELIRREARIDEEEDEMIVMSPGGGQHQYHGFERHMGREVLGSSSSELDQPPRGRARFGTERAQPAQPPSQTLVEYSGNENGSYTDVSDTATWMNSALSLSNPSNRIASQSNTVYSNSRPKAQRNLSQMSGLGLSTQDEERVVFHGWLYILKSKGGVRQWKKLWVVLRPKTLALYKDQEEYSASLIIPFSSILDAVDIDPVSRSKRHCMQIISEERNYRFCAPDEDALARWLGAFKSLLAKRKEAELQRAAAAAQVPQLVR